MEVGTESTSTTLRRSINLLLFISIVLMVVTIALTIQVQARNRDIDRMESVVSDTQTSVIHLEDFVEDLELQDPDEVEQNAAITRAVQIVPEIRDILCEQFPGAEACQQP